MSRLAPLASPSFRRLFASRTLSVVGTGMAPVGLAFAVLQATGSTSDLGFALASRELPLLLVLPLAGALADRLPRERVVVAADLLAALGQAVSAALVLVGGAGLAPLLVAQAVSGVAVALAFPALSGLLPQTVAGDLRREAGALLGLTRNSGLIAGAALGGLLAAVAGPGWALAGDALSYLASAAVLLGIRLSAPEPGEGGSVLRQLREGWREFVGHPWLWPVVVQFTLVVGLGVTALQVYGAVVSRSHYGGPAAFGLLAACQGAGQLLGGVVVLHRQPRRPLVTGLLGILAATPVPLALALLAPLPLVLALAVVLGVGLETFDVLWVTALSTHVRPEALSRVSSFDALGSLALAPLGFALMGVLGGALGTQGVLLLGAGAIAIPTLVVLCLPAIRGLRAAGVGPAASNT